MKVARNKRPKENNSSFVSSMKNYQCAGQNTYQSCVKNIVYLDYYVYLLVITLYNALGLL